MNDFNIDLEYSMLHKDDSILNEFYKTAFPRAIKIDFVKDLNVQKKGIDKIITLQNGKEITVDEKKRRKDYGDILLEVYSNLKRKKWGWLVTAQCDYIVYAIIPAGKVYLLPVLLLKMAAKENWSKWYSKDNFRDADNQYYITRNIAVKTEELLNAIKKQLSQSINAA